MVVHWQVVDGRLEIRFETPEDIKSFIDSVVKGPAEIFGLEVIVRKKEKGKELELDVVRL
ncbi:MAG: hypothetical protein QXI11_01000 [Thermoproteota archaeon]